MEKCPRCASPMIGKKCQKCGHREQEIVGRFRALTDPGTDEIFLADDEKPSRSVFQKTISTPQSRRTKELQDQIDVLCELGEQLARSDKLPTTAEELRSEVLKYGYKFRGYTLETWGDLHAVGGHVVEVAYQQLQDFVLPRVNLLWKNRAKIRPAPDEMLRSVAAVFQYSDLGQTLSLTKELADQKAKAQEAEDVIQNLRQRLKDFQPPKRKFNLSGLKTLASGLGGAVVLGFIMQLLLAPKLAMRAPDLIGPLWLLITVVLPLYAVAAAIRELAPEIMRWRGAANERGNDKQAIQEVIAVRQQEHKEVEARIPRMRATLAALVSPIAASILNGGGNNSGGSLKTS